MTASLADIRDAVKADLREATGADWSDAQVDRAIALAVAEYGRTAPLQKTTIEALASSRTVDLSSLNTSESGLLLDVLAVEYPIDQWPPIEVRFSRWAAQLTIHSPELVDGDVRLYYTTAHTLTASASTVPEKDADLLAVGAAGYALHQLAVGDLNTVALNSGAPATARQLAADRLAVFREGLRRLRKRVNRGRMFRPEDPTPGANVVAFPD